MELVIEKPKCDWLKFSKKVRNATWHCRECGAFKKSTGQPDCACSTIRIPRRPSTKGD